MNENVHRKSLSFARIYTKCNQPEDSLRYIQDIAKLKKDDLFCFIHQFCFIDLLCIF